MRVTIIGLGLIGGSLGLALKQLDPPVEVAGYDIDAKTLAAAKAAGAIDTVVESPSDGCVAVDFVFIATPLGVIPKVLAEIAESVEAETVVTDVGSTKQTIIKTAGEVLPADGNFIGGHPMAGSDQGGFESATATLFREAVYVLTPTASTGSEAFQGLHALLTRLEARVMALSPAKHDEVVAAVSHLPHVLAAALVNHVATVDEGVENRLLFAAGGFRDTTRIAGSNPDLWVDICIDNQGAIVESIDSFRKVLSAARDQIAAGDARGLRSLLASAKERRLSMSIGETAPGVMREVDVIVSDRPGAISEITRTFGQMGINIEDIRIVHLSGEKGVIKLMVFDHPQFEKALQCLREYDFNIVVQD